MKKWYGLAILEYACCVLFLVFALFGSAEVHAQGAGPAIPVSTGSPTGTYSRFIKEAQAVCPNVRLQNMESSGSAQNLDRLEANEASLGIVQVDVLNLYSNTKDMSNIKVLIPLFPEQLHFVTRADLGQKEGGYGIGKFKVGASEVVLNTVEDLKGRTLAAAGGSFYTAQVFNSMTSLGIRLQEVKTADDALAGVASGVYDAALLVGAQPLQTFVKMGTNLASLKLLPIPEKTAAQLGKIYAKAQPLNYRQMGQGGSNVPTLQVMSSLVTQNYRKGNLARSVAEFQKCLYDSAEDQAGTPGTHPAWRNVKPDAQSNWPMWSYSESLPATQKKK